MTELSTATPDTVSLRTKVPSTSVNIKWALNFTVGGVGATSCWIPASINFIFSTLPILEP